MIALIIIDRSVFFLFCKSFSFRVYSTRLRSRAQINFSQTRFHAPWLLTVLLNVRMLQWPGVSDTHWIYAAQFHLMEPANGFRFRFEISFGVGRGFFSHCMHSKCQYTAHIWSFMYRLNQTLLPSYAACNVMAHNNGNSNNNRKWVHNKRRGASLSILRR